MQAASLRERDAAIESVRNLVWQIVRRHLRCFGGDPEDAYQECVALLCQTWPQYDAKQSAFTTWVTLTCKRHLRQSYALGRLDGPIVRVAIHAFKRGERMRVSSIHAGDGCEFELPNRESRPAPDEEGFIALAASLVGRELSRIERQVLVSRYVEGKDYRTIAKQRHRYKWRQAYDLMQKFKAEARRWHKSTTVKERT